MEDANFDQAVASQAVSYLYIEEEWIQSIVQGLAAGSFRDGPYCFMDRAFLNEIDYLVEATKVEFDRLCFRDGIHRSWFDMIIARDMCVLPRSSPLLLSSV